MNQLINKNILFDNFSGKATPLQKQMIELWLSEPENVEYYYLCLDEWETENLQFWANEQSAFNTIIKSGYSNDVENTTTHKRPFIFRFFANRNTAIASIIILVAISSFYFTGNSLFTKTIQTAYGETQKVVLPDGSIVTLNSNSSLQYSRFGFGTNNRVVHLKGEADFSVKHTYDNKKFLVTTDNDVNITVLGTEFTAYARETSRVVLKSGKIELDYKENKLSKKLLMKPGDLFNNEQHVVKLSHVVHPESFSAWKNHEFIFENTSLFEVAKMFKESYDLVITFESTELGERRISGSFHADDEDELLNAIVQLLDINYKYTKGKNIYFFD